MGKLQKTGSLYCWLQNLYPKFKPLYYFLEHKLTFGVGIDLDRTTPWTTVTFREYLIPDHIAFFLNYNRIRQKLFPFNPVHFPSRIPDGLSSVNIKMKNETLDETLFNVVLDHSLAPSVLSETRKNVSSFVLVNGNRLSELNSFAKVCFCENIGE